MLDLFNRMRDCLPENIVGKRYDMPVNPGHESATFVIWQNICIQFQINSNETIG